MKEDLSLCPCGNARYNKTISVCVKCRRKKLKAMKEEIQKMWDCLDAEDPNSGLIAKPEVKIICNHCGVLIPTARELGKHKETHNVTGFRKPDEEYSVLPSSQNWNWS